MRAAAPPERLFLAVWPAPAERAALGAIAAGLPSGWQAVPAADLHLTVLFLGSVPAPQLQALHAALATLEAPAFRQPLTRLEFWDDGRLACACGTTVPAALGLRAALERMVAGLGLACERRPLRAHVTLARARRASAADSPRALAPPRVLEARAVVLAASRPGVPRYHPLCEQPLAAPGAVDFGA